MKILSVEKEIIETYNLDDLDKQVQFSVVDLASDIKSRREPDIIFPKLMYVEDYIGPALDCDIGGNHVMLPLSWYIFIGEEEVSEIEVIPVTSLNSRSFTAIATNPIDGFRHHFLDVKIYGVLTEYEWVLPKIKNGQSIAVPINDNTKNPLCIYLSHSSTKIPNSLSPSDFM